MILTKVEKKKTMFSGERVKGRKIAVIGCGTTGVGLANLFAGWGEDVVIFDDDPGIVHSEQAGRLERSVRKVFGSMPGGMLEEADLIVKSPGVPRDIQCLQKALSMGIPVIGELETTSPYLPKPTVAITGTNGKTTTTTIVGQMLENGGKRTFVGGNIGVSIASVLPDLEKYTASVIEASSFQLEDTQSFHPQTAVLLNITPDHLNRHGSMRDYTDCKTRIFMNQTERDAAILNGRDPATPKILKRIKGRRLLFNSLGPVENGVCLKGETIVFCGEGGEYPLIDLKELSLAGVANVENLMAAALAAQSLGIDIEVIRQTIRGFNGLEHRIESVATINGVRFVNDSKGTNVGSVKMSLKNADAPVILIAGGKDKGGDFTSLAALIREKVKAVFLIGEAGEKIREQVCFKDAVLCSTLREAVFWAFGNALAGDLILLSPACASFDMFKNYVDRGNQFKKVVAELMEST